MSAKRNAHVHFAADPVLVMDPRGERDASLGAAKDGRSACDASPSGAETTDSGRMAARKLPLGVWSYEGTFKTADGTTRHQASVCHGSLADDPIHECVAMIYGDSETEAMMRAEHFARAINGLDALLSAAAKAIRVLDAEARPDASAPLREAVDAITGGRGTWSAAVQIGAAVSHCIVTGTWLDARQEAAALLGVSANNVTMRRVK